MLDILKFIFQDFWHWLGTLFNGKRFYDEDNSPQWAYRENQKTLNKMLSSSGL